MARFDYLDPSKKASKGRHKKKGKRAETPLAPGGEELAAVYLRRETVRAVWRELKDENESAESISELTEHLLLEWLGSR